MNTAGKIGLLPQDILAMKGLKHCMDGKSLRRLKALVEEGPVPLHIPPPKCPRKPAVVLTEDQGLAINLRPVEPKGATEETLKVVSAGWIGPDLSLLLRKSFRIDTEGLAFIDVARAGAFELEAMAFAFNPLSRRIYISGNGPLGSAVITPERFSGGHHWELWKMMAVELSGIEGTASYVCSMVDIRGRPGRITLAGMVESNDIPLKGEAVPWIMDDVLGILSDSGLDRRLRTALLVCGHAEWGLDFLKKADK